MAKITAETKINPSELATVYQGILKDNNKPISTTKSAIIRVCVEAVARHYREKYDIIIDDIEGYKYLVKEGIVKTAIAIPSTINVQQVAISQEEIDKALEKFNKID